MMHVNFALFLSRGKINLPASHSRMSPYNRSIAVMKDVLVSRGFRLHAMHKNTIEAFTVAASGAESGGKDVEKAAFDRVSPG